jgi:uncharacterized protein with PhoU and TrkA domain
VIVLAIRTGDGRMQFNPSADTAIHGGDYLIVMGKHDNLRTLEGLLAGGARHRSGNQAARRPSQ